MLAKNLAGLLAPTEGKVLIEGRDLSSVSGSIAPHIGYVFQDARMQIVGDTVLDDVLFGPTCQGHSAAEAKARAQAAIAACRLSGKEERFSHQLSGGESRLLAIAGVLALCPKALLLDEPFANLDPSGVRGVLEVIQALALDGLALLVISHEIEKVLGLAKALFVMDSGRVVLSGRPDAVLREGIARYGLRDPFMPRNEVAELTWL
jgi:energy-coupling factor transporter ATP-binding protein EcfA2